MNKTKFHQASLNRLSFLGLALQKIMVNLWLCFGFPTDS